MRCSRSVIVWKQKIEKIGLVQCPTVPNVTDWLMLDRNSTYNVTHAHCVYVTKGLSNAAGVRRPHTESSVMPSIMHFSHFQLSVTSQSLLRSNRSGCWLEFYFKLSPFLMFLLCKGFIQLPHIYIYSPPPLCIIRSQQSPIIIAAWAWMKHKAAARYNRIQTEHGGLHFPLLN